MTGQRDAAKIDYEKIGLKVGLEIHQQLDTDEKLFCSCPPGLFKDKPKITFLRKLRPTQSELGQIDPAAYFEFKKGMKIQYEADDATSCLVEMDEEPPHGLNAEAVDVALTVSMMMGAKPVDEVHVMRKTVIDGSNTTGFQRTCVVALDGEIAVGQKAVPIQHVSLEEDAARKTGEEMGDVAKYRIDRLGIPLIEVATAPVIRSPEEAAKVALAIGSILRATGKVMRGLGTIRQDLNVSLPNGALVEIKGVQELELVSLAVEYEARRQLNLLKIRDELLERGIEEAQISGKIFDATPVFKPTKCKVIRKALDKGQPVLAVRLAGFGGFLKRELLPNFRLGTEMADRARFWGRVGGLFHTDEMPAYGVSAEEVAELRKLVGATEDDAVVFVADAVENAQDGLKAVVARAREALKCVPEETRAANADGTTRYMRPRPGAARMYPETDVPPVQISDEHLSKTALLLPDLPEKKLEKLMKKYGLNEKLAKQVLDSEYSGLFEVVVRESGVSPITVAAFMTETVKALKRDGMPAEKVTGEQLLEVFRLVGRGELTKEALPEIVAWLSHNEGKTVDDAVKDAGLKMIPREELEKLIKRVVEKNEKLVVERGQNAFGALMGLAMKELRGKADAALVGELLKQRLERLTATKS